MELERGSTKHGRRLDDEMEREVQGRIRGEASPRAEEWREPEPSGEDQPDTGWIPNAEAVGGAPPGMTPQEVEGRSRLGRVLPRSVFPAGRDTLLDVARQWHAPDDVIAALGQLPPDREFHTVAEVWAALGHHNEERRT